VQRLLDTGHWFDHMQPRANWPFGELQHSSRPFDALLLAGAFILSPFFGTEKALLVAGTWSSATLYLVLCGAIAWTGTRLFSQSRGMVAAALLMSQFPVLAYSIPGRADHHTLILVVLAATIGLTASLLKDAARTRTALFAGCIAGFGLWLSPEFLLIIGASFIALGWSWIRHGHPRTGNGLFFAVGLAGMTVIALLLEYRPADYLTPHFDRISSVHVVMAILAVYFWIGILLLERRSTRRAVELNLGKRLAWAMCGAGVTLGLFALLYPEFFGGPSETMDRRARIILLDLVMETRGLLDQDLQITALYLWSAVIAVPIVILRLISSRNQPNSDTWVYLATLLAIFLPASLFMLRFSTSASVVSVLIVADACVALGQRAGGDKTTPGWPLALRWVAGTSAVGACLWLTWNIATITGQSLQQIPVCHQRLKEFSTHIDTVGLGASQPMVIVAMADMGPEILYRTKHRVIATPSMSNQDGAIAIFEVLDARDDRISRPVIKNRGVDHILICRAMNMRPPRRADKRLLIRLVTGNVPGWLEQVPLTASLDETYALYRVRR
jgi:hypothetical protein